MMTPALPTPTILLLLLTWIGVVPALSYLTVVAGADPHQPFALMAFCPLDPQVLLVGTHPVAVVVPKVPRKSNVLVIRMTRGDESVR